MTSRMIRASGLDALNLATRLLQRARLADPRAGVWEAADAQWSWRQSRRSDDVEKFFWLDDDGPVAGVLLTSSRNDNWQCDPVFVPGSTAPALQEVWQHIKEQISSYLPDSFDLPIEDTDLALQELVKISGFTAGDSDSTAWMAASDRPAVRSMPEGFGLRNRNERSDTPHHMINRNDEQIAERLAQCSLYDPELDLAIETSDGRVAGHSMYWFDPVTKVGLVEPVRVEDEFQRRGLASAMLCTGLDLLVSKGAESLKVSYETEIAGKLYESVGFKTESTTTWYSASDSFLKRSKNALPVNAQVPKHE